MPRYYARLGETEYGFNVAQHGGMTQVQPFVPSAEIGSGGAQQVDLAPVQVSAVTGEGLYSLIVEGRSYQLYVERTVGDYSLSFGTQRYEVQVLSEREWRLEKVAPRSSTHSGTLVVAAPMPGLVKAILAREGNTVALGERLVVLEAMKMENDIVAPRPGTVTQVHVEAGAIVEGGKPLVTIE